jgi:large subunit ribosomal protein LP1
MAGKEELACTYASLILSDDDIAITGEKIQTILTAADITVEPYWPGLFARALEGVDIKTLITNVGSGVGGRPGGKGAAAPVDAGKGGAPAADKKKEEKKKVEEEEEDDDDMGFGLFD